jgi:hypothetical protein
VTLPVHIGVFHELVEMLLFIAESIPFCVSVFSWTKQSTCLFLGQDSITHMFCWHDF